MDRSYDWMTNRFVQDFANVGINGLDLETHDNGDRLYRNAGANIPPNVLGNTNNSVNLHENTSKVPQDVETDFHFDDLTDLNIPVKQERELTDQTFAHTSDQYIAQPLDSSKTCVGSGLEPVMNNDLDPVLTSGLDTVTSSYKAVKMEVDQGQDRNTAQKSPDTTEDIQLFKKRDQKRRPKPKDGTSLFCVICGDRALGYNFDAITCESCKAFFRRNALKTKVFACSFEGNCKLDPHTRKFCSGCRLKKCFDVGMKKDWILSEDQLAKRRKKSRSCEEKYHMKPEPILLACPTQLSPQSTASQYPVQNTEVYTNANTNTVIPPLQNEGGSDGEVTTSYLSDSTDNSMSSPGNLPFNVTQSQVKVEPVMEDLPQPMPPEIEAEIQALEKDYHGVFDMGYSELQAKKMVERPHTANELFNMTDIFIRRLIKFAKHIPEFKSLKQEDQIYLLKGGIMEIMVLRSAMGFDPHKSQWKIKQMENVEEHGVDPKIIKEQLGQGMYTNHMQFVTSLHQMTRSNSTVMTLLFVIEIFSPDRPNIVSKEEITRAQEKFLMWLRLFMESIMPVSEARDLYPKLLAKLLDVRDLGESSSKLASHLDITKLEPLLIEVFNLQK